MRLPGQIMMGAQGRLIPAGIPYGFFMASSFFHLVAWALIFAAGVQVADFQGGPGYVLGALHALTLGVFAMTAIGASFQILPVVTNQSPTSLWPYRSVAWLFVPGASILIAGFAIGHVGMMETGGAFAGAGLLMYAFVILSLLNKGRGFKVLTFHVRLAFVALAAVVVLGVGMIFDLLPLDHLTMAGVHGTLAIFGFMGLFAMGFGSILVPMFALAQGDREGRSLFILGLYGAGLLLVCVSTFAGFIELAVIGAGALLLAAVYHVLAMRGVLKKGMKKNLGLSFTLIRTSWFFLPLSIAVGVAAVSGVPFDPLFLIAAYLAVFGWLLTFILGVMQQIMPFLAAMNVSRVGGKSPRLSELARTPPLKIHAVCHFLAMVLLGLGIAVEAEYAVRAAGAVGVIGAMAFMWFTIDVYRRMRGAITQKKVRTLAASQQERSST